MTAERSKELKSPAYYDFILPDGTECGWVFATDKDSTVIYSTAQTLIKMSSLTGKEYRLRGNADSIDRVAKKLAKTLPGNVEMHWGGNKFFEYNLKNENRPSHLDWSKYQDQFNIVQVLPGDDEKIGILKTLMMDSFGTNAEKKMKIEHALPLALQDNKNYIYLVQEIESEKALGSFVSKYINDEVQLHSVAGKSEDPRILHGPKKLPIIMAAFLATVDANYPQGARFGVSKHNIKYDGVERVTFSASGKVVSLYEEVGFEASDKAGILFRGQNIDL